MHIFQDMLEWLLIGISSDAKKKLVSIRLQNNEGVDYIIVCHGVDAFRVTDMLLGNVVENVEIWQNKNFDDDAETALWSLLYGVNCDRQVDGWRKVVLNAKLDIESSKKSLMAINPIYGATVLVLAEDFQLHFAG